MKFKSIYITKNDLQYSILDQKGSSYRSSYNQEKYLPLISMDIYGSSKDVVKNNSVAKQKEYLDQYNMRIGSIRGAVFLLNEYDQDGGHPAHLCQMASADYQQIYNILGREGYIIDKERKLYRNFFYIHEFSLEMQLEDEELRELFATLSDVILELYHIQVRNFCYLVPPIDDYYQFIARMPQGAELTENPDEPYPEEFMKKESYDFMTRLGFMEIGKTKLMVAQL